MKKIMVAVAFLILIMAICVLTGYFEDSAENKTQIILYESTISLDNFTDEISSSDYYKNCNKTTLNWLENLNGNYVVVPGVDAYYVMLKSDADKIPVEYVTDVSIRYICKANIDEKRPLSDDLDDVIFVSNLEYLRENITYYDV